LDKEKDLVSVIIPSTKKELHLAERCVYSVQNSSYKNIEIIVVCEGLERSEQRNLGIERAHGSYLFFLDSDQYVSTELIKECVEIMHRGYGAIYIPEEITASDWFGRLRNWERSFYVATPVDVVRFVRAEGCPKFCVELRGPEDSDFDHRVKGLRAISKNCLFHNDHVTLLKFLNKKAYYSQSMARYKEMWPDDRVLRLFYRCVWIFIENGKWKRFLARPISAIEVMFLIFLRGVIYLWNR
jgi:glycosyltransferase involved in cell wall biosynthesis